MTVRPSGSFCLSSGSFICVEVVAADCDGCPAVDCSFGGLLAGPAAVCEPDGAGKPRSCTI